MAVQRIGAVLVPVYPTITVNELEYILDDAQVKLIFVTDANLADNISAIRNRLPFIQQVYSFDYENDVKHWKEIKNCQRRNF